MESVTMHSYIVKLPPPLPPKTKARTPPGSERSESDSEYYSVGSGSPGGVSHSSAPSVASITGSKPPSALASSSYAQNGTGCGSRQPSTVFLAGSESQPKSPPVQPAPRNGHVVTIRINPVANATQTNGYTTAHATISPTTQPSSINENKTYKSSSKVSLNQTNAINTIGKFIVNICESGEKSDNNYPENKTKINGTTKINIGDINIGEINSKIALDIKREMVQKQELITNGVATNGDMGNPYFFCNPFPCSQTNLMSSGQCSPSDTLDSGTCSDLDGSPPPLPKKKNSKSNGSSHKRVSVTVIGATSHNRASSVASSGAEVDSEDSESNISCDSLNSSELSTASIHEDSGGATFKSEILKASIISSEKRKSTTETIIPTQIPSAPAMPTFLNTPKSTGGFLPQGLLQDIRDRSAKLSTVPTIVQESTKTTWVEPDKKPVLISMKKEPAVQQIEEKLTSFTLVSRVNSDSRKSKSMNVNTQPVIIDTIPAYPKSMPIVNESTYVDRKLEQEKQKQEKLYSGNFLYDTDKYYDFHLNENVFDEEVCDNDKKGQKKGVNVNGVCNGSDSEFFDEESMEYFAGYKDYKNKDAPAAIRSAKGTIRGVKNRVRAGIATFLQMQNTTAKSYKEKDAGKVVVYTTSMGIVRGTYQKCLQVKKILRTLLVKFEERDVFMSGEYQEEIKDRMRTTDVLVPQIFVDSQHIGDADTVERLNESGELRRMLKPYKSADACTTCQTCGGYRLLPCPVCSGSKKSVHRNHFTAEFVALKCMNCDEVGLVKCDAC